MAAHPIVAPSARHETYAVDSWPLAERVKGTVVTKVDALIAAAERGDVRLLMSEMNLGEIFSLTAKRPSETRAETVIENAKRLPTHWAGA